MRISLIILAVIISNLCFGQIVDGEKTLRSKTTDTIIGWKKGGIVGLNLSQASFSNWAAGGQNSISFNGLINVFANYKKENTTWDNMLDLGYGFLQQGKNKSMIKTDDKIDFTSKYGKIAKKNWYYAILLNFKTQMLPGYNYPDDSTKISDFLAPGYLLGALGMDYKPNSHFNAFIAPITSKNSFVNNTSMADAGAFGVDKATYDTAGVLITHGKKTRSEFGGYIRINYQTTFFSDKSVSLLSKLDLYSNYLHNPENVDVNWETIIGFKVNKFISATITAQLVYDDDTKIGIDKNNDGIIDFSGPRTQFKEVIGIGFNYKF
ncbi:MAG: DUF3078 domain-containing protein [Bacteroidetes bacterium]|nr:DUF3078 domain-containing protein [Bacteroidota bacterium]